MPMTALHPEKTSDVLSKNLLIYHIAQKSKGAKKIKMKK